MAPPRDGAIGRERLSLADDDGVAGAFVVRFTCYYLATHEQSWRDSRKFGLRLYVSGSFA